MKVYFFAIILLFSLLCCNVYCEEKGIIVSIEEGFGGQHILSTGIARIKDYLNDKDNFIVEHNGESPLKLYFSVKWEGDMCAVLGIFTAEKKLGIILN